MPTKKSTPAKKSPAKKATAPKKAAKKAAAKKSTAFIQIAEDGKNYSVKVSGKGGDLVSMLKQCMEQDEDLKTIIRLAAIL